MCVYDKYKGGTDFWGIINLLRGETSGDQFGNAISIDNNILAVGAPNVSGSGMVYVFRKYRYMDSGNPCYSLPTGSTWQEVITAADFCQELQTSSLITSESYTPTFISGNYTWQLESKLTSVSRPPVIILDGASKQARIDTCWNKQIWEGICYPVRVFVRFGIFGRLPNGLLDRNETVTATIHSEI